MVILWFLLPELLRQETDTLGVGSVSGTVCADFALQANAQEREVADDVQKFVSGGFVLELKGRDVAQFGCILSGLSERVCELVHRLLGDGILVDDEGVLQISAFDESAAHEVRYLANEAEGARRGYLCGVVGQVGQLCYLVVEYLSGEGYLYGKLLMEQTITNSAAEIDLSDKASGIYFLRVVDGNNILTTQKVIRR